MIRDDNPFNLGGGNVARERPMDFVVPRLLVGELNAPVYAHDNGFRDDGAKRNLPGTIVPAITLPHDRYVELGVLDISARREVQSTQVVLAIAQNDRAVLAIDSEDHQQRLIGRGGGYDEPGDAVDITNPLRDDGEMLKFYLSSHALPGLALPMDMAPPLLTGPFSGRGGGDPPIPALAFDRQPREVWIELRHLAQGNILARDTARVTIAPFIVSSDIDPPHRLYVFFITDQNVEGEEDEVLVEPGNFGFVRDLIRIAAAAGASVEAWDYYAPDNSGLPVGRGVFAQDHHLFGYTTTPNLENKTVYYVTTMPHAGKPDVLEPYQVGDHPAQGFRPAPFETPRDSLNFGGNVVASPPVAAATAAIDEAGTHPRIPAHPAAPYGKLIVGASTAQRLHPALAGFLKNQVVQPIVPIDSTWLRVRHADEIVSFATAPDTVNGGRRPLMCLADPDIAVNLLFQLVVMKAPIDRPARSSDSDIFAKFLPRFQRSPQNLLGELGEINLVLEAVVRETTQGNFPVEVASLPRDGVMSYMAKLDLVHQRLLDTLGFGLENVVGMPVLFGPGPNDVKALLPNTVNFQLLGTHMIIPKPWGPRVSDNRAIAALIRAGVPEEVVTAFDMTTLHDEELWLMPGQSPEEIATEMGIQADRIQVIESNGVPFRSQPSDTQWPWADGWRRVRIRHLGVCIFEAYISVMLNGTGLTLHFTDDFRTYHAVGAGGSLGEGEIHCGTNVARLAPQIAAGAEWWRNYADYLRVDTARI